jgi:hypothetical protein
MGFRSLQQERTRGEQEWRNEKTRGGLCFMDIKNTEEEASTLKALLQHHHLHHTHDSLSSSNSLHKRKQENKTRSTQILVIKK